MKKIMFSDKYGLTRAVLEGRKTQTRRLVSDEMLLDYYNNPEKFFKKLPYHVGDTVAVLQRYAEIIGIMPVEKFLDAFHTDEINDIYCEPGFTNKMFAKASLMPFHILITDVRIEKLQTISRDDCLAEGVAEYSDGHRMYYQLSGVPDDQFTTAFAAYAYLFRHICGALAWDRNPFVVVYTFKTVV